MFCILKVGISCPNFDVRGVHFNNEVSFWSFSSQVKLRDIIIMFAEIYVSLGIDHLCVNQV